MTLPYQELSKLCDSLHNELTEVNKELDDAYKYSEQLQDRVHDESMRSIKLNVLVGSLNKRIKRGYIN